MKWTDTNMNAYSIFPVVQDTSCGEQCRQHRTAVIESLHRYLKGK